MKGLVLLCLMTGAAGVARAECADARACETACSSGGGGGADCEKLGSMYENGDGVRVNVFKAAAAYGKACDQKRGHACYLLARFLDERRVRIARPEEPLALFGKGCEYGDFSACDAASSGYGTSPAAGANQLANTYAARKQALADKMCDAGDGLACASVASRFLFGDKKDLKRGRELVERTLKLFGTACDAGDANACKWAADAYNKSEPGFQKDVKAEAAMKAKAEKIWSDRCTAGSAQACAQMYLATNDKKFGSLACDRGEVESCLYIGELEKKKDIHVEGCKRDSARDCARLAGMYSEDLGSLPDPSHELGKKFLGRACDLGDVKSCCQLKRAKSEDCAQFAP